MAISYLDNIFLYLALLSVCVSFFFYLRSRRRRKKELEFRQSLSQKFWNKKTKQHLA